MMQNIFVKVPAALLLAFLIMSCMVMPVSAASMPFLINGYASVDGTPTNGVHVSCNGASYTTKTGANGPGYFEIMPPNVQNSSQVTITFEYDGHTTATTVTANSYQATTSANIVIPAGTPTPTPTATATVTVSPTATAGGSGTSISYFEATKATARASVTPSPTSVAATAQPTATASAATPTAVPSATAASGASNSTAIYLVIGLVAVLAIAGAAYYLFMRKP